MVAKAGPRKVPRQSAKRADARETNGKRHRSLADLAQRYLDRYQPTNYRINAVRDGVEQRGDTWFIVAEPDRADAPGYDFINRITEASMEMEKKEKIHVFLVPVIPPEDD